MARLPRLYAPDLPNLAQAKFTVPLDAEGGGTSMLDQVAGWLADEARLHGVAIHGWALLPDQLLLLATPSKPTGLSMLVQAMGRRLAARLHAGPVFAGRFRSTLVEPGAWVLPCMMWVECAPLRQGLVGDSESWRWSSAAQHMGAAPGGLAHDHADYWACGNTPFDRQANYRARVAEGLPPASLNRIEQALRGQWALGGPVFLAGLEGVSSRRPVAAKRGRPRKAPVLGAPSIDKAGK